MLVLYNPKEKGIYRASLKRRQERMLARLGLMVLHNPLMHLVSVLDAILVTRGLRHLLIRVQKEEVLRAFSRSIRILIEVLLDRRVERMTIEFQMHIDYRIQRNRQDSILMFLQLGRSSLKCQIEKRPMRIFRKKKTLCN